MTPHDMENLRKFSICADQHADGMTIVPQALLAKAHAKIERLRAALKEIQAYSVGDPKPRHTWYYDRAEAALSHQQCLPTKEEAEERKLPK
jgi:hypothetical protein